MFGLVALGMFLYCHLELARRTLRDKTLARLADELLSLRDSELRDQVYAGITLRSEVLPASKPEARAAFVPRMNAFVNKHAARKELAFLTTFGVHDEGRGDLWTFLEFRPQGDDVVHSPITLHSTGDGRLVEYAPAQRRHKITTGVPSGDPLLRACIKGTGGDREHRRELASVSIERMESEVKFDKDWNIVWESDKRLRVRDRRKTLVSNVSSDSCPGVPRARAGSHPFFRRGIHPAPPLASASGRRARPRPRSPPVRSR